MGDASRRKKSGKPAEPPLNYLRALIARQAELMARAQDAYYTAKERHVALAEELAARESATAPASAEEVPVNDDVTPST